MEIKNLIVGPIFTNCYLLTSKDETAVIDPGGEAEKILKEIEGSGKKLKYIILTHSHWDHTSAALKIKKETEAEILIHEAEEDFLNFEVDRFLKEGDKIKIGDIILKVIHTPGHTKGGICLLGLQPTQGRGLPFRGKVSRPDHPPASRAPNFIFTGDTLFKEGFGRTDLPGGSSKDLQESLEKLSKFLKPGMKIYPGHGEIFEYQPG